VAPPRTDGPERLQRTLARAGFGSRRAAEELIRAGRVHVNGQVAELGRRVDPERDRVTVDGIPVPAHPGLRYLALNKPEGVTTTMRDPHAADALPRLIPPGPRVFPVGRLDRDSEGLLLLTNDGELAHRLQHPRYGIEKEYLVEVPGPMASRALRDLRAGVMLDDGTAKPVGARLLQHAAGRSSLQIVMSEGRKREVRRMLAAVGFPVLRLVRTRVDRVQLSGLRPGATRPLTTEEIEGLYRATGLDVAKPRAERRASGRPLE
jgi:23S rRNA pseudouridine2605 synthase